jgi:hypothetical protein
MEDRFSARMKFLAKLREVHFYKMIAVPTRIVVSSPALVEESTLGYDFASVFQERHKQAELNGRERYLTVSSPYLMATNINP